MKKQYTCGTDPEMRLTWSAKSRWASIACSAWPHVEAQESLLHWPAQQQDSQQRISEASEQRAWNDGRGVGKLCWTSHLNPGPGGLRVAKPSRYAEVQSTRQERAAKCSKTRNGNQKGRTFDVRAPQRSWLTTSLEGHSKSKASWATFICRTQRACGWAADFQSITERDRRSMPYAVEIPGARKRQTSNGIQSSTNTQAGYSWRRTCRHAQLQGFNKGH